MAKTAVAIRHVAFEDLGVFEAALKRMGYSVRTLDAGIEKLDPAKSADLTIILGGPIGAYEDEIYPFLADEIRLVEHRMARKKKTLGICLGAQIIARAAGAAVEPGRVEISFGPVNLMARSPLDALKDLPVLHWHSDTFALPEDAKLLASTLSNANQAFSIGAHTLALQFHIEANAKHFERWLIGHTHELGLREIDIPMLREAAARELPALGRRGVKVLASWLRTR